MDPKDHLIVALDYRDELDALRTINNLANNVNIFKLGQQAMSWGYADKIAKIAQRRGKRIFWDVKLHDTSDTMAEAAAGLATTRVDWFTVHGAAGKKAIRAAVENRGNAAVVVVTVLTAHDTGDCQEIYGSRVDEKIRQFSETALECGAQGIVSSVAGLNFLAGFKEFNSLLKFAPGIRPDWFMSRDNHSLPARPSQAIQYADYLIIGRPITDSWRVCLSEVDAVKRIKDEIKGEMIRFAPK